MSLENFLPCERSQAQETTYCMICMIPLYGVFIVAKAQRQKDQWLYRDGGSKWGVAVNEYEVTVCGDGNVLNIGYGDVNMIYLFF